MDVHDKKTRSFNMSKIKASGTKPELQGEVSATNLVLDFV